MKVMPGGCCTNTLFGKLAMGAIFSEFVGLSRRGNWIESESVRISKVSVMEAIQKLEPGDAVKPLRCGPDSNDGYRLVKVQKRP